MDKITTVKELASTYPGMPIKLLPEDEPTEIVVELGGTASSSRAVAVIDRSVQHFHRRMVETYRVLKGSLNLYIDGELHVLTEGETFEIQPNRLHWAEGDACWVEVDCTPPWTEDDHILSPLQATVSRKFQRTTTKRIRR